METRDDVGPLQLDGVPVYEAAVSAATAERFGLSLGETVELIGDPGDPLIGRTPQDVYAYARLTGIYEVPDPDADFWLDDPLPIRPVIRALSAEVQFLDAAFLLADGTHAALGEAAADTTHILRYTWRSFLDPERLTDARLDTTIRGFRRLAVQYPSANVTPANDVGLRTGMLAILEQHRTRWTAAESIIAVTALGPALVAGATLALVGVLASRRRRSTMALARSRGAAGRQVLWPAFMEGVLLSVPAAALAAAAAFGLVAAGRLSATLLAAGVVAGVATAVIVATVLPVARTQGPDRSPRGRVVLRAGGRRLVFEAIVVALAIAAAYLLRERGLAAVSAGGELGFDPLIAAVPALAGLAAGIIVVRLFPVVLTGVSWVAARRRGLVPMLAARRAGEGGASSAVLLVLLATATVGAFAVTSLNHLDRGADLAAWQDVGAPYRLQQPQGPLPRALDLSTLPEVEASAGVFEALIQIGLSGPQSVVVMPDAGALERVNAGTPAAPRFPTGFATPAPGPIPAIVATSVAESPRGVALGDTFALSIEGYTLEYRVVEVRDSFPGAPDQNFIVIAREAFLDQAPPARVIPVYGFVRAPASAAAAIRAATEAVAPTVAVTSEAEIAAGLRDSPVTRAVRGLIVAASVVTAFYAALGVAAALALAGLARSQETAHLRTLGLTARQTYLLTGAEHGPTTLVAFLLGILLGVGLFALLRNGLGISGLVGSPPDVPVVLDPVALLLILLAMTFVVGVGLLLGVLLQRRVAPTAALRGRFE